MRMLLMILALLLAGTGCARHAAIDYQPGTDFGQYTTWAWADTNEQDQPLALDARRIEEALKDKLGERELEFVDPEEADLLVRYAVEERARLHTSGVSFGLGMGQRGVGVGVGTRPPTREITEGFLVVELVERESRQVIWRGVGQRAITEGMSPQRRAELITRQLGELLERYPPE